MTSIHETAHLPLSSHHGPDPPLPPLEPGDHLTRHEFERRYAAMAQGNKAELIEGVVYMPSPVHDLHAEAHGRMSIWLGTYLLATPGGYLLDNATVRLDLENEPQPDLLLRIASEAGGRSRITPDRYVEGAPELIIEIAGSSAAYDLHTKLCVYRRNGVQEYIVWLIYEAHLHWFSLVDDEYVPRSPNAEGILCSQVFPGLCLDVFALLHDDRQRLAVALQRGLKTAEHSAFVEQLSKGNS